MLWALTELEREGSGHSQRTAGRFVTEDAERIRRLREELARQQVKDFLEGMCQLGLRRAEILDLITQEADENAEGEEKTVQGVLDVVLQDKVFYEESGGGITLSGGEMLYQPDFALQLLLAAKEEGLHTCCETTGFLKTELFAKIIEQVDYILFDMKHWNSKKHKEGTGIYNELILSNMTYAVKVGKKVLPRIPVIPGFNDSLEDAIQFAATLRNIGITTCQLLPFHQFGENKYDLLGKHYAYKHQPSLHKEDLEEYKDTFIKNGIKAFF